MKKIHLIICCLLFVIFSLPLFAAERIIDNAGILSAGRKAALEARMEEIASTYNFNLLILTEKNIGTDKATAYSWNYLDSKGLGGETWDGCLLLQSLEGRDYDITASGRGSKILNNAAFNRLEKDVVSYLKQDDYPGAYEAFINNWEKFLVLESKGRSYNFLDESKTHLGFLLGGWIIAFLIGFFVVRSMKAQMNTALPMAEADMYIIPGSMALTNQQDRFLYSTVTKTKRQSSSSSSSGGSSSGGGRSSRSGKY